MSTLLTCFIEFIKRDTNADMHREKDIGKETVDDNSCKKDL
jgi:hypothetical protein